MPKDKKSVTAKVKSYELSPDIQGNQIFLYEITKL